MCVVLNPLAVAFPRERSRAGRAEALAQKTQALNVFKRLWRNTRAGTPSNLLEACAALRWPVALGLEAGLTWCPPVMTRPGPEVRATPAQPGAPNRQTRTPTIKRTVTLQRRRSSCTSQDRASRGWGG
eukprot:3682875-Rhodomonas_salina.1